MIVRVEFGETLEFFFCLKEEEKLRYDLLVAFLERQKETTPSYMNVLIEEALYALHQLDLIDDFPEVGGGFTGAARQVWLGIKCYTVSFSVLTIHEISENTETL